MKTILISGATGFLGGKLTAFFKKQDDRVIHILRDEEKSDNESVLLERLNPQYIDSLSAEEVYLINLSGANLNAKRWTDEYKKEIIDSRVETTKIIVSAIQGTKVNLINASAVGYYGDRGNDILTEISDPGDTFLSTVCLKWESAATKYPNTLIARFGVVLDTNAGAFPKLIAPFKMYLGGQIGKGDQYMSWIHLEDFLNLMKFVMDNSIKGIINFTSPEPVTNQEFSKAASFVLNKPNLMSVPEFAIKLIMGEQADMVLDSQRVIPEIAINKGYKFKFPDIDYAIHHLVESSKK